MPRQSVPVLRVLWRFPRDTRHALGIPGYPYVVVFSRRRCACMSRRRDLGSVLSDALYRCWWFSWWQPGRFGKAE